MMHHQDFIKLPPDDSDNNKEDNQDQEEDTKDDKDDFQEKMDQLKLNEHVLGPMLACTPSLRCFENKGSVYNLDHLEEALKQKNPDVPGDLQHAQACALKGQSQYVIRLAKKSKKSPAPVMVRLKVGYFSGCARMQIARDTAAMLQACCGPKLLSTTKRKPSLKGINPDAVETQPVNEGSIPAVAAPHCLAEVLLKLETAPELAFPHHLQYKKPFRNLVSRHDA
ncbi:unnamed protein product, partial [Symbiodinium sp. CCMP2592]